MNGQLGTREIRRARNSSIRDWVIRERLVFVMMERMIQEEER